MRHSTRLLFMSFSVLLPSVVAGDDGNGDPPASTEIISKPRVCYDIAPKCMDGDNPCDTPKWAMPLDTEAPVGTTGVHREEKSCGTEILPGGIISSSRPCAGRAGYTNCKK